MGKEVFVFHMHLDEPLERTFLWDLKDDQDIAPCDPSSRKGMGIKQSWGKGRNGVGS